MNYQYHGIQKRAAQSATINDPHNQDAKILFKDSQAEMQREYRRMYNAFWEDVATKMEYSLSSNDMGAFHEAMKVIYGANSKSVSSSDKEEIDGGKLF